MSDPTTEDKSAPSVCIIGSSFHFMSGISTHTCMEANAMADTRDTSVILMRKLLPKWLYPGKVRVGEDLTLLRYRPEVDVFDGVDYYWLPSMVRACAFLIRRRPKVLAFQWWSGTVLHSFLLLAFLGKLLGAKIVIEFHETLDTAEASMPLVWRYVSWFSRPLMAMCSAGAVHGTEDVAAVRRRFPQLENKPVIVIPMGSYAAGVDPERWTRAARDDEFRLLFFGTIRPYKGVENVVRAFDQLRASGATAGGRRFVLTVVGETWEGWTLPAELIASSPYRADIEFVNTYVTDVQAAQYFHDADAVVLPYLRSSASGPLHMAMSHGMPVAVTAVGGLIEATQDYSGARLVRPGDIDDLTAAMSDLVDMPGPHADPHSWSVTAERLAVLF